MPDIYNSSIAEAVLLESRANVGIKNTHGGDYIHPHVSRRADSW